MRALIGGVGYPDLSDHSISWAVVDALERRALPADVTVEDASYNPVAFAQRLDDEPAGGRFEHLIFISAISRGREAGAVTAYRWDGRLPVDDEIQRAVTDAVTGIIYLDNTLVVARHLKTLPERVTVIEIEPVIEAFGQPMSQPVADAVDYVCELSLAYAVDTSAADALPVCGLGGPAVHAVGI